MSTPLTEYITVTVSVADRLIQTAGFGTPALFDEFTKPTAWSTGQRVAEYSGLTSVGVDFANTTKIYKLAAAVFTGDRAPKTLKVIRADSGDSNITDSLDAIALADSDWYGMAAAYRTEADLLEIAAWLESQTIKHIAILCSQDAGVIDSGDSTDIASDLQGFGYDRTAYMWHHQGGLDAASLSITVASLVATVTSASHGLEVGDPVTVSGAAGADLNGNKTVATVPTDGTFTYVTSEGDGADVNNGSIAYFARYTFPEARWLGYGLSEVPGKEDWAFKPLTGQTPAPTTAINQTQQGTAKGKNANIYTSISGLGATQIGTMASGRFLDIQTSIDWLDIRLGEALIRRRLNSPKIPYTQKGIDSLKPDLISVLQTANNNGMLGVITSSTAGEYWQITMPQRKDVSSADVTARNLPAIAIVVQMSGSIITFNVEVSALL